MAASARIEELRRKFEENPRRYFAPLANEYRKAGDLGTAIAICRAQLAQHPEHMSGHIVLGQALYETGDLAAARRTFETAVELDPENVIALRHLGDIARTEDDASTARRWYGRLLDADPGNEEVAALVDGLRERRAPAAGAPVASAPAPVPPVQPAPHDAPAAVEAVPFAALLDQAIAADRPAAEPTPAPPSSSGGLLDLDDFELPGADSRGTVEAPVPEAPVVKPSDAPDAGREREGAVDEEPGAFDAEFVDGWDVPQLDPGALHQPLVPLPVEPASAASAASVVSFVERTDEHPTARVDFGADDTARSGRAEEASLDPVVGLDLPPAEDRGTRLVAEGLDDYGDLDDAAPGQPLFTDDFRARWGGERAPEPPSGASPVERPDAQPADARAAEPPVAEPAAVEASEIEVPAVPAVAAAAPPAPVAAAPVVPAPAATPVVPAWADAEEGSEVEIATPFVTETMAELFVQQGHLTKARDVFAQLVERRPDDAELRERARSVEARLAAAPAVEQGNAEAKARDQAPAAPAVGPDAAAFFAGLAGGVGGVPSPGAPSADLAEMAGATPPDVVETEPTPAPATWVEAEPVAAADLLPIIDELPTAADAASPADAESAAFFEWAAPEAAGVPELAAESVAPLDQPPAPPADATLASLFGEPAPDDDRAAGRLAAAFGAPATGASSLLDDLATAPGVAEPTLAPAAPSADYSFDRFFAGFDEDSAGDAAPAAAGAPDVIFGAGHDTVAGRGTPAAPAPLVPPPIAGGAPADEDDLVQFNAWLRGLRDS